MSKSDEGFAPLVDEHATQRVRPRGPGFQNAVETNRANRMALADSIDRPEKLRSNVHHDDKIDLFLGQDKDGFLDPVAAPKKFVTITDNIDEVERQMMRDAPKPPEEGQYKVEDVFDQSFKDLMKDGKSVVATSITTESESPQEKKKCDEDEFDVF
eukprot:NODE_4118_length_695_cov_177.221362_g3491_i0.p1 GENE.NODE_4118_length_695_cov_177.221362_g3491_i0~~NODE_4118_length_695_cov_177.221362_g3491_i0.p1  ORF type:complete len:156 (-),score=57.29 NODE_4118_length_695_cov_177.221362_g3491_i0:126-593(-)